MPSSRGFPAQGSKPHLLQAGELQADSLLLSHQGSPGGGISGHKTPEMRVGRGREGARGSFKKKRTENTGNETWENKQNITQAEEKDNQNSM